MNDLQPTGLDYATLDFERATRCGFPEVVFGEGKTVPWTLGVVQRLHDAEQTAFVTRVNAEQAAALRLAYPAGVHDVLARTFVLRAGDIGISLGDVLVVTAGTGDLPVAHEAKVTAEVMGANATLIVDVGVAGLHRIIKQVPRLRRADVIIVVAGMDGALPSVVGGLVDCPVVAVPTSIGYGAAFGGVAALLTMLNSCAAGVAVVNIDAGFKAGELAARIIRRLHPR